KIPALPLGIVCPVDGRITAIEKVHDAYLDRTAICISIKMSFFDVYSVHSPMEGKITKQWQKLPRKIQSLATVNSGDTATIAKDIPAKANIELMAFAQSIKSDEDDDVVLVMEASTLLPRPHCYVRSGERMGQGQRCGFLQFGTQVDVLVPESTHIDVTVGERVLAGTGIIATLVRTEAMSSVAKT
ncbi:MAG: phosphatidylserine decarboxylase, partial [Gammaproteobacteria bacterium]